MIVIPAHVKVSAAPVWTQAAVQYCWGISVVAAFLVSENNYSVKLASWKVWLHPDTQQTISMIYIYIWLRKS